MLAEADDAVDPSGPTKARAVVSPPAKSSPLVPQPAHFPVLGQRASGDSLGEEVYDS